MKTVAGIVLAFAFALGASSFANAQDNERLEAIRADVDDRFIANANRLATEANAAADEAEVAAREARAFPTCVGDARRTVRTLAGREERCVNSFLANDQAVERAANAARSARGAEYQRFYQLSHVGYWCGMIGAGILFATVWSDVAATQDVAVNITPDGGVRAAKSFGS